MGERWAAIRAAGPVILLIVAVFGGLYSGIFTVTEAASVAAVLSLLFALARGRLNWATLLQGLRESAAATGMIYVMIMGALIFTYFLNLGRVPEAFVGWISQLNMPPLAIIDGAAGRLPDPWCGVRRDLRDADHAAAGAASGAEARFDDDAGRIAGDGRRCGGASSTSSSSNWA